MFGVLTQVVIVDARHLAVYFYAVKCSLKNTATGIKSTTAIKTTTPFTNLALQTTSIKVATFHQVPIFIISLPKILSL